MSDLIEREKAYEVIASYFDQIGYSRRYAKALINKVPSADIVRCENCRKSHIDGKTTHYLYCTEWGRSTDVFGYCERGEREGE